MYKMPPPSFERPDLSSATKGMDTTIDSAALFNEMRANGLGHQPEDLGGSTSSAPTRMEKMPPASFSSGNVVTGPRTAEMRKSGVFSGNTVGPMAASELDAVMAARAPWEQVDGADTSAPEEVKSSGIEKGAFDKWLEDNFDKQGINDWVTQYGPEKSRTILEGMFSGETHPNPKLAAFDKEHPYTQSDSAPTAKEAAPSSDETADFGTWVNSLPKDFVDKMVTERGNGGASDALLAMYKGQTPDKPRAEGTFINASTGEEVSQAEAVAQLEHPISPDAQAAIRETVEAVTGDPEAEVESKVTPEVAVEMQGAVEQLIAAVERGDVLNPNNPGVKDVRVGPAADGTNIEIVTEGTGNGHTETITVDVEGHIVQASSNGETTIDNEPVTTDTEAQAVAQVLEHVTENSQAEAGNGAEAATNATEAPTDETVEAEKPTQQTTEEKPAKSERPARAEVADRNVRVAGELVRGYVSNPDVQRLLQSAGVDVKSVYERLKQGGTVTDPDKIKRLFALANEVPPRSQFFGMFRPNPNGSTGERSAANYQRRLKEIFDDL